MTLRVRMVAEFIGTFWLVLGGCGSAVLAAAFPNVGIGLLGVSLAFGLTVLTMAYAIGQLCRKWLWRAFAGWLLASGVSGRRSLPHIYVPHHHPRRHRRQPAR